MNPEPLIACVDVDYRNPGAVAAGLWFRGWTAEVAEYQATAHFPDAAPYEPGAFYRRELPCLIGVLALGPKPDAVIVDGYVWLANGAKGLGAHLHDARGGVIIGVAKTRFASATDAIEVCRGASQSPLFVSTVGMPVEEAAARIAEMHGQYRVPTLLKCVDAIARATIIE